jgi:hypothetical protein
MRSRDFGKGLARGLLTTGIARAATALAAVGQAQKIAIAPSKNTMMHGGNRSSFCVLSQLLQTNLLRQE